MRYDLVARAAQPAAGSFDNNKKTEQEIVTSHEVAFFYYNKKVLQKERYKMRNHCERALGNFHKKRKPFL